MMTLQDAIDFLEGKCCGEASCLTCCAFDSDELVFCACGHPACVHNSETGACWPECDCKLFDERERPAEVSTLAPGLPGNSPVQVEAQLSSVEASADFSLVSPKQKGRKSTPLVVQDTGDLVILNRPDYQPIDKAANVFFSEQNLPPLGGASGGSGWSSFSTYQRCPKLYYLRYVAKVKEETPKSLELGSLLHLFLALHYLHVKDSRYPASPEALYRFLSSSNVNMEIVLEGWRLFEGYRFRYQVEDAEKLIEPLAIEHHVVDPETKQSCRYDMIAKVGAVTGIVPGVYIWEHKSASKFDQAALEGWQNDGEVIGQIMLYQRLKLTKQFGKLQGVIVNLVGKQKQQKFVRIIVAPRTWQTRQHASDLRVWTGLRALSFATNTWPHARNNCVTKHGMCSFFSRCSEKQT